MCIVNGTRAAYGEQSRVWPGMIAQTLPRATLRSPQVDTASLLGDDAGYLLDHEATAIGSSALTLPGPDLSLIHI